MEVRIKSLVLEAEDLIDNIYIYKNIKEDKLTEFFFKQTVSELEILINEINIYIQYLEKYEEPIGDEELLISKNIIKDIKKLIELKNIKENIDNISENEKIILKEYCNIIKNKAEDFFKKNKEKMFNENIKPICEMYINILNGKKFNDEN